MNKEFLFDMLTTPSVSGSELLLEKKIYEEMQGKTDSLTTDEIGDVVAVINPDSPCKILMTGHVDEIGLMVTAIENGMLKVTKIGGICAKCYPGHKVRVITENGVLYGAVVHNGELIKKSDLGAEDLTVDIGATSDEEAKKHVSLGDTVIFDTDYRELLGEKITGRALDDRLGAFIVMQALLRAKEKGCKVGAYAASTVGEETTMNGSYFVSSRVQPTAAIAVDVTYTSDYPGTNKAETGDIKVGGGPVLCNSPSIHKKINQMLYAAAKRLGMEVQTEAASGKTHTDADTIHQSGRGVPVALVSIPIRYMHTPAEVGSLKDVSACIELLAEFLCELSEEEDFKLF